MSFWELRRLALVIGSLDLAALAIAFAGSLFLGGWNAQSIGLWMFLAALPMLLAAGGSSGTIPMGAMDNQSAYSLTMENEMLAQRLDDNRQQDIRQRVQMSWTTAIALAGIPLLLVGGALTLL